MNPQPLDSQLHESLDFWRFSFMTPGHVKDQIHLTGFMSRPAHARADARNRRARTRARFRTWAASVRRERAAAARQPATEGNDQRATGKRPLPHGSYSETREYRPRASQEEITQRRTQPRRLRLGPTASVTEIGKRLRDDMCAIAVECHRYVRRHAFGDG